jgi:hypothetical protein
MIKTVVTTSNRYHHLLPVFFYLYGKYWNEPFDLVGYAKPECEIPDNCTWVSMGDQGPVNEWSTDLRKYFEAQKENWFVWLMEDTIIKEPVDDNAAYAMLWPKVGRINLTNDVSKREHTKDGFGILYAHPESRYRLSTQPSIWNKEFLLKYLTPGLSPWDFETQDPKNDGWSILALEDYPVKHNEGVNKRDIYKLDLTGVDPVDIDHIKTIAEWLK